MSINNQTQQSDDPYQYSFTKDFQQFSYIKKFLTIVLLPLLPIFIVSKGFQMRAWRNEKGEQPPSAKKYYFGLGLLYVITIYPLGITLIYFAIQLNGWIIFYPVALLIAYYFHKKDYEKEEVKHGTKSDEFRVLGFRKASLTFLVFLLFILFFTFSGALLLLTVTSFIFIFYPNIYKKFYFLPRKFLILSYSFFSFLNFIPGIYVSGEWFIEKDSEIKLMKNPYHIIKHILSNFEPFFILNVGISALMVRILVWVLYRDQLPPTADIVTPSTLSNWGFFSIFLVVPLIMAIYFSWVWVWSDAEIKVAKTKFSTGSSTDTKIKETTLLVPVSDSIKRLFTYLFGISSIVWLVDIASTHASKNNLPAGTAGIIAWMFVAFFFTGISTIFMGIMYYRSGVHEYLVNKLRKEIIDMYLEGNSTIKVCYSGIQEVDANVLITRPAESIPQID